MAETFEAATKDAQAKIDRLNSSGRTVGTDDPGQPKPFAQAAPAAASGPERYDLDGGAGERRSFGWKLYDEKYLFQHGSLYSGKDASG